MLTAREKFILAAKKQKRKQSIKQSRALYSIPDGYLTVKQICDKYHRAESGIYKAIAEGKVDSMLCGRNRIIAISEIERYFSNAKLAQKRAAYKAMCKRIGRDDVR